ncbi:MAG: nitrilase-related carbon-nitrogen hydrolase [Thermoanaerobaculia bacterium]|jgi:predicted amidohydrolase
MANKLTVGLAQIDCTLGAVEGNLQKHLSWIEKAREQGVELLLFPELSITGYRLLHLTSRVSCRIDESETIRQLADASGEMAVVVGLVEEGGQGVLYNSAVMLRAGQIVHVHRKLYLPTYGIFQEGRFFGPGQRLDLAPIAGEKLGLLICEDLWHPQLAQRLAAGGGKVLGVLSAGPGRVGSGETLESQEIWECITRSTAVVNTSWLLYCNRVGWEEGSFYAGGSHIVRPGGQILCRAANFQEDLLVATLDLREVDRLRWRLPLLRAERADIEGPG